MHEFGEREEREEGKAIGFGGVQREEESGRNVRRDPEVREQRRKWTCHDVVIRRRTGGREGKE